MAVDEAPAQVPAQLWHLFSQRQWDQVKDLLHEEDFEVYWPQTREKIVGRDNFIELNRIYPGDHKIEMQNVRSEYDRWEQSHQVITEVYIHSKMPDGTELKLFAVSFFEINGDEQIASATEYWADCSEPPEWRKHLVERC